MENAASSVRIPLWRTLVLSLLLTAAVWSYFHLPMLQRGDSAIPCMAEAGRAEPTFNFMEPGDHLQLMYHFWLFDDMMRGGTPWFGNIYEFNLGDDAARQEPGTYYFPFSFFYAVGDALVGRAFGWNLAGFLSLWLTVLFTVVLLRRFTHSEAIVWLLAAVSIALPYRWYVLAGGSPAGFAMCWPPLLFLGLDLAVRDDRWRGGVLAGLAVLLCAWDDTHSYFFGLLLAPAWCLFALLGRERLPDFPRGWFMMALRLSPVLVFLAISMLTTKNMTGNVAVSRGPRSWRDVALSSPNADGFFSWTADSHTNHIYLGYAVTLLLALGALAAFVVFVREKIRRREVVAFGLLLVACVAVALLALGVHGPIDGLPMRAARKLIPKYDMIRQSGKIFTVLPPMLLVAAALSLRNLGGLIRNARTVTSIGATLAAICLVEYATRFHLRFCVLTEEQPAYAAVAKESPKPHALVIPLWPGDSHYTATYQHYASLYRIRMVNGYRPFVPEDYRKGFWPRFESANLGELSDAQLDELLQIGVNAIILHEDLFPEKVSPVPVTYTLRTLLNHPRLTLLAHSGAVWSWRIEREPRANIVPLGTNWTLRFPSQKSAKANPPPPVQLGIGETFTMPAPEFFHAGTVNLENNSVMFDPARDRSGIVLYGPRLTFPAGRYELTIDYNPLSNAQPNISNHLGNWTVQEPEGTQTAVFPMDTAGFSHPIKLAGTGPLLLLFSFTPNREVVALEIKSVSLRRLE